MNWLDLGKKVVEIGAPLLGGALGGPAGASLGGLIASAFGGDSSNPDDLYKSIISNPDAVIKLREIELNHKTELEKLSIQKAQDVMADISSARSREVELTKTTGKRDLNLYVLAWTVVVGFFVLCAVLMFAKLPDGSSPVVYLLFGTLCTGFGTVLAYFFGSSASSADKTALINNSIPLNQLGDITEKVKRTIGAK